MSTNCTTFLRVHTANRGVSTYKAAGFPGVVQLAKAAFNGVHPDSIDVCDVPEPVVTERAAKAKLTPEEKAANKAARKAAMAAMTPAQKAADKLAKAQAAFAKITGTGGDSTE